MTKFLNISTDNTLGGNSPSDDIVSSQKAIKTALDLKQTTSNLVTSVSSSSTDSQYPSAKCVYDIIGNIETLLSQV